MTNTANKTEIARAVNTIALVTAVKGNITACTAIMHAPSGLERTYTVVSEDCARNEVALKCMIGLTGRITSKRGFDIDFASDNKYLNDMFGGEYKRKYIAGEEIEYNELWKKVIANLREHHCHLETAPMPDNEMTERAKATVKYHAKKAAAKTQTEAEEAAA